MEGDQNIGEHEGNLEGQGFQERGVGYCRSDRDVHRHMGGIFVYPSPYDTPIWGSTVLPSTVAIGCHAVYRPPIFRTIQAQFAAAH